MLHTIFQRRQLIWRQQATLILIGPLPKVCGMSREAEFSVAKLPRKKNKLASLCYFVIVLRKIMSWDSRFGGLSWNPQVNRFVLKKSWNFAKTENIFFCLQLHTFLLIFLGIFRTYSTARFTAYLLWALSLCLVGDTSRVNVNLLIFVYFSYAYLTK